MIRHSWPPALTLVVLLVLGLAIAPAAVASKTVVSSIGANATGVAGGVFNNPRGVAVNRSGAGGISPGTIYVVDSSNNRIQQFGPTGAFVRAWGWGVRDGSAEVQVCTVAANCLAGLAGAGAGQLSAPQGVAVDQSNGALYVTDQGNRRVDVFAANGAFEGAFGWGAASGANAFQFCAYPSPCSPPNTEGATEGQAGKFGSLIGQLAVDPSSHDIYVADRTNRRVDVFTPILTGGLVTGVAFLRAFGWDVSSAPGVVFEVCTGADCKAPGSTGTNPGRFGNNSPTEVGIDQGRNVYALDAGNNRVQKFDSALSPVGGSFGSAELTLPTNFGSGALRNLTVDPATGNVAVAGSRSADGGRVGTVELSSAGAFVDRGLGLTATVSTGIALAGGALGGNVYVASNSSANHRVSVLNETTPAIDPVTVFSGTTATFTGAVVSKGFAVTYRFEYSKDGEKWLAAPAPDADAGMAPGSIGVSQDVTGLTGSQPYRVRLVATRPLGGGTSISAETMFTTAPAPPAVSATKASQVTATSATLSALVDPQNEATTYWFEHGSANCALNPCARFPLAGEEIGSGSGDKVVNVEISGLQPGTLHHFRVVATNGTGLTPGPDMTFKTYPASSPGLPDGRAYELVSPPDTRGLPPTGIPLEGTDTWLAAPSGNSVLYAAPAVPGFDGTGNNDEYRAVREGDGWESRLVGPSGAQSEFPAPGGASPDHSHTFVRTLGSNGGSDQGSLAQAFAGTYNSYVRGPAGGFELVGHGSLGNDPEAIGRWITAGAGHMIFVTGLGPLPSVRLEPAAPPSPFRAVYDRTPTGLHVISLLPGDLTPSAHADLLGISADGSTVAFEVAGTMYMRRDNATTLSVSPGSPTFAGASHDGAKVIYVKGAEIFSYDTGSQSSTPVAAGGGAAVVNVSADGTHVYFISTLQLDGAKGAAGANNLYAWSGGETRFVATVAPSDVTGPVNLLRWASDAVAPSPSGTQGPANAPSRSTPDGRVLVFQSRASLTGYDSEGHWEIFRYEEGAGLACISCSPIDAAPTSDAQLQSDVRADPTSPVNAQSHIANLTEDGSMVFFQTGDALVPGDVNGAVDVYEWHEGDLSLISSGRSGDASHLYGVAPDGHDVFFLTREELLPEDRNGGVGSIYDARIGGGFAAEEPVAPCTEDACQGLPAPAPALAAPASATFAGPGNLKRRHRHRVRHKRKKQRVARHQSRGQTRGGRR